MRQTPTKNTLYLYPNPVPGPDTCTRVIRGGSWLENPWSLRAANREGWKADTPLNDIGFRVARTGRAGHPDLIDTVRIFRSTCLSSARVVLDTPFQIAHYFGSGKREQEDHDDQRPELGKQEVSGIELEQFADAYDGNE